MKITATERRTHDTVRCTVIQDDMAHLLTVTIPAHLTNQQADELARIIVTEKRDSFSSDLSASTKSLDT